VSSPGPTAEDFSGKAVQRAVLKETLQHPLTILPAAVSALSLLYMGLISFDPGSFGIGFGAALFGAGVWVVNYFFRGEHFAAERVRQLRAQREQGRAALATELRADCEAAEFAAGTRAAEELTQAYENLRHLLAGRAAGGDMSAVRFAVLADDTYQEGLQLLTAALETHRALRDIDADRLRNELRTWTRELASLEGRHGHEAAPTASHEALRTKIDGHRRRLGAYDDHAAGMEKVLAQCETLESALETAYLQVLDLGNESTQLVQGQAAARLESAVTAARAVEERLRAVQAAPESDALYLQQGQRNTPHRT
jgi:hypothetical protein